MQDSSLEVQKALVAALKGNSAVSGLVGQRVYDVPPQGVTFPYISLGPRIAQPEIETIDAEGWELSLTIDSWSRKRGSVEAQRMMSAVTDVVNNQEFSLTGHAVVLQRLEFQSLIRETDQITSHGIQRFIFWTCPTP